VVDQMLFASLRVAGLPEEEATLLAATKVDVTTPDARSARVVQHLASGDTVEFTVAIEESNDAPGIRSMASTSTGTQIDVHLEYVVSANGMPEDVLRQLSAVARPRQVAWAGGPLLTGAASAFNVVVDWSLKKVESTLRDKSIQAVLEAAVPGQAGTLMKLIKAGFTVEKGVKIGAELDALLDKLDALADCAANPTNPLTQQEYARDPSAKQRLLDQIGEARREVIANYVVQQLGVLNGFAAGFGPKWLGYAIGPGTAWSAATLKELSNERLGEIERAVPKCDCATGGSSGGGTSGGGTGGGSTGGGTSGGGSSGAGGDVCEFPFILMGEVTHTIIHDGEIVFTSHATQVKWQFNAAKSQPSNSLYDLVAATVEWRYDDDDQIQGCTGGAGTIATHGGGTENGVPDEAPNPGGELGPGDPDENAFLSITWASYDPNAAVPSYWGQATTRLHDKVTQTRCGGSPSELDPDWMYPGGLPIWFQLPSNPFPVMVDGKLEGKSSSVVASVTHEYEWSFAAQ
jgi:uncharacterized membrane protein YgcG